MSIHIEKVPDTSAMREVSKADFYAAMGPLDVHPRAEREASYWELRSRHLVGISTPGYMGPGLTKRYFLKKG